MNNLSHKDSIAHNVLNVIMKFLRICIKSVTVSLKIGMGDIDSKAKISRSSRLLI